MPSANGTSAVSNGISHDSQNTQRPYDLVCVGFGPASLAIAVALKDKATQARVLYLERQQQFKWHGGMLLPDARMQISFLKDLATLRDPRSEFTFLNYLKSKDRLVAFTNLSTFLPLREEYNDYLTWCASHFEKFVQYGQETVSITPLKGGSGKIEHWEIVSRDVLSGESQIQTSRHVVIAVGGRPKIPAVLSDPTPNPNIIHSSSYSTAVVPRILAEKNRTFRVAVIGGGQSAAEIFNDLQNRFDNTVINLYTGDSALRPSDDSPFVNEVFDPEKVDEFYDLPSEVQQQTLVKNRATNYGVVRPELLDHLYENMYHQRLREPDEEKWSYKIIPRRVVHGHTSLQDGSIQLELKNTIDGAIQNSQEAFDLVIVATGYARDVHETLLAPTQDLLETGKYHVGRDYRIRYRKDAVDDSCGIWLQGCCEGSHGLSDTLLSILSVRGGEIVDYIFRQVGPARSRG